MGYTLRRFVQQARIAMGIAQYAVAGDKEARKRSALVEVLVQVCVSIGLLAAGLYILLDGQDTYDQSTKKLAAGWIGGVSGYWLR